MNCVKRVVMYLLGFFILGIGVNLSKNAGLGISPVSSIPYAVEKVWGIELGKATYGVFSGLIALQIILMGKKFQIKNLLQVVPTFFLGTFITLTSKRYLMFWLPAPANYVLQLVLLAISIVVIGIGVFLFLVPNIMPLPAEGLCGAIACVSKDKIKFGNAKVMVDTGMVAISALLSIAFLGGLKTVREGTVLAALLVGKVVGYLMKNYKANIMSWFNAGEGDLDSEAAQAID